MKKRPRGDRARLSGWLTPAVIREAHQRALDDDTTVSEVMEQALARYLTRRASEPRRPDRRAAAC